MSKVKLTITSSNCRCGFHEPDEHFMIDSERTICPPVCMELWHQAYPYVFALLNGADLDCGEGKCASFDIICPDQGRVSMHGELIIEKREN